MMTGLRTRLLLLLLLALTATAWAEAPRVETWENGLRCLVLPTTSSQVVSVELLINFSALDEPATLQGLRQVVVSAMMNTPDVNGTRRELTAAGGTLRAQVHQDMVEFAVTAPAGALPQAFQALADIICRPQLSDQAAVWAMRQAQQRAMAAPTGALEGASRLSQDLL